MFPWWHLAYKYKAFFFFFSVKTPGSWNKSQAKMKLWRQQFGTYSGWQLFDELLNTGYTFRSAVSSCFGLHKQKNGLSRGLNKILIQILIDTGHKLWFNLTLKWDTEKFFNGFKKLCIRDNCGNRILLHIPLLIPMNKIYVHIYLLKNKFH